MTQLYPELAVSVHLAKLPGLNASRSCGPWKVAQTQCYYAETTFQGPQDLEASLQETLSHMHNNYRYKV